MVEEIQRVVMSAHQQTIIKAHGLRDWVDKGDAWPSEQWNAVIDKVRDAFAEAGFTDQADILDPVVAAVAEMVVRSKVLLDYFLDNKKRKYSPADQEEWNSIAHVVARLLVQRYNREMGANG